MNLTTVLKRTALTLAITAGLTGSANAGIISIYTGAVASSVLTSGNWNSGAGPVPSIANDASMGTGGTGIRTMNTGNLTVNSLNLTAGSGTYTIRQDTTSTTRTLTLGGAGSSANTTLGAAATDLIYVASGPIFNISNGTGSGAVLNLVLGQSGTFDIVGTSTINALISGSGFGVNKTGGGSLTLSGANTFTGGVSLDAGTLVIGSSTTGSITDGPVGTGTLTLNGGTLSATGTRSIANPISLAVSSNTISATNLTLAGTISGPSSNTLLKTGTGTSELTISGNNNYDGQTIIDSTSATGRNVIVIKSATALGSTVGNTEIRTGSAVNGARLELQASFTTNEQIAFGGTISTLPATAAILPARIVADNGINEIAGDITTLGVVGTASGANTNNYFIRADGTTGNLFTISGEIRETSGLNSVLVLGGNTNTAIGAGLISGDIKEDSVGSTWNIYKQDPAIWTLTGNNTYVGTTTVNAGKLLVNGTNSGAGAYTVLTGGTLGGTGSIGNSFITVNSGGFLSPGTSIESLDVGAVSGAGKLMIEYDGDASTPIDLLNVASNLDVSGMTIDFDNIDGSLTPLPIDGSGYGTGIYILATYGSLTGTFANVIDLPTGYAINYNYNDGFSSNNIAIIPEPGPLALTGMGFVALTMLYKRRKHGR